MLRVLYKEIINKLSECNVESADLEARIILHHIAGIDYTDIISKPDMILSAEQCHKVHEDGQKRISGMPLSRIYGEQEFWGMPFKITQGTLDPRQDTETIIDLALKRFSKDSDLNILDLGTGSGCILIALLSEFKNASGVGVDISQDALETAKYNTQMNGCADRSDFICGSWFDSVSGKFDLIVSNPPYIRSDVIPELSIEVRNHDPIQALDGGTDGLDAYKIIFSRLKNFLKKGGIALFEIGYDQEEDVMRLAEKYGFVQRCVHLDMAGNPRVVEISCGDK